MPDVAGSLDARVTCPQIARTVEDLTAGWFSQLTGTAIQTVGVTAIGAGQMSSVYRVVLHYALDSGGHPTSFIVKLASSAEAARQAGLAVGLYESEVRFYREIAPTVSINVPRCHYAEIDPENGWFTIVMNDNSTATAGDMLSAGTPERARLALAQLVGLQAPRWDDPVLQNTPWMEPTRWIMLTRNFSAALEPFLARFENQLTEAETKLCRRVMPQSTVWHEMWDGPIVIQHGDYRPDNVLFAPTPDGSESLTVFDWQTTRVGPPLVDPAYYLGGSLAIDDRRATEERLVRDYHHTLVGAGVTGYDWKQCWEDYRRYALYGLISFVGTSGTVEMTQRGETLFLTAIKRFAAQAIDLGSDDFLP